MQAIDRSNLIGDYQNSLVEIAEKEGIVALSQFKECLFDGKHALELLRLAEPVRQDLKIKGSNDFDWIMDDIISDISSDIVFSLKNAYLYRPGINDFTHMRSIEGQEFPIYEQTLEDKRYLYFCGVALEKIYAYWDRIGDILNLTFELGFPVDRVYFNCVMKKLEESGMVSENLIWLCSFKDGDYKDFSAKRHDIVHHRGLQSYFRKQHLLGVSQKEGAQYWVDLQNEKWNFVDLLKEQQKLTIEGFEQTILLIASKSS